MNISTETFLAHLAIDLVAIGVLLYFVYYRRHRRRDLLMACISFNVALFLVVTVLAHGPSEVGLAAGIGLFGAVSLIRLRSEELSYIEVAYFFSALALALINGFGLDNQLTAILLNGILLVTVYAVDRVEPAGDVRRIRLTLDAVYPDEALLRAELERRLGAEILEVSVREIDFVRETTQLQARYSPRAVTPGAVGPVALHPNE
jgi:Domain of unknown function (DUF4956)